jgi:preprotein translocase subunit SecA
MFNWILKTIVGSKNQRELRRIQPLIRQINEIEETLGELSDDALRAKTAEWKQSFPITDSSTLAGRFRRSPRSVAVVKQGARALAIESTHLRSATSHHMGHGAFDVQLIGGVVLIAAASQKWPRAKARPS